MCLLKYIENSVMQARLVAEPSLTCWVSLSVFAVEDFNIELSWSFVVFLLFFFGNSLFCSMHSFCFGSFFELQ